MDPESATFTTSSLEGVRLHTLSWGDPGRPPLVLLHGGGANSHWWEHLAPDLARDHRVTALDFRGHGRSDYPEEVVPGSFERDLGALLEHLGTRKVVLIGHSMGARVALAHAARDEEVRALVLIDIARGGSPRDRRRGRLALSLRRTYASREEAIARYRFLPDAPHIDASLRDSIARSSVREEPDGRFSYRFDPRWFGVGSRTPPTLSNVRSPTLILRGEESVFLTEDGERALLEGIPRSRSELIVGAGHHLHLDQPGPTLNSIRRFVDSIERAGGEA